MAGVVLFSVSSGRGHGSVPSVLGTVINTATIVLGGVIGLTTTRDLSAANQSRLKVALGAFTVYAGLSTAVSGFSGSFGHRTAQFGIALLALMLGNLTGQILRLQKGLNKLGRLAQEKFAHARSGGHRNVAEGFMTCTVLFCVGPMAVLGALQDGLGNSRILVIKSVLDGLATLAFSKVFGWGVLLAAIPVLAYQGTITMLAQWAEPYLRNPVLEESLDLTGGLLVFCIALIILELKKVALADYLPSLIYAPVLSWLWLGTR